MCHAHFTTTARPSSESSSAKMSIAAHLMALGIRAYQVVLSPLLGPVCRYYPTCSNYALEAIAKYGARQGGWMAFKRILRCHPFRPGGYDPVP